MYSIVVLSLATATLTACSGSPMVRNGPIYINELMARNSTVLSDDEAEFDDWVELYNDSGSAIDLAGWYISDNANDPQKAQLPQGLEVPAGGVLLLWCDGDTDQGPDHLPFRLSGDGEEVLLTNPEGNEVDHVEFGALAEDVSFASFPDGGDLIECPNPTPGELNGDSCQ